MTPWPPLIIAGEMQRWMVWRDRMATIVLWLIFMYLLVDQSIVFWREVLLVGALYPDAFLENWHFRLKPFGVLVLLFFLWLLAFGLLSLRHWRRVTRETAPPPLPTEIESHRRGMAVERIAKARGMKVATIAIDDTGKFDAAPKDGARA